MAKINQSHTTDIIQTNEHGEVTRRKQITATSYNLGQEPPFIKMYLDNILYIRDLPKAYNPILTAFLKRMTYANSNDPQLIYVNSDMKKTIAKELGLSVSSINNALFDLTKGEIFERVGTGTYQVNPHLFGRGEWKNIGELRLHVTFNADGKTVMGEVIRKSRKSIVDENQLTLPLPENEVLTDEHTARADTASNDDKPIRVPYTQGGTIQARGNTLSA